MEKDKVRLLEDVLGPYRKVGSEIEFYCPRCKHHKKKLSINLGKNCFKCWVCLYSGRSIRKIIQRYGSYEQHRKWIELDGRFDASTFELLLSSLSEQPRTIEEVPLPEDFKSLVSKQTQAKDRKPISYLKNRGLNDSDIAWWKIGYSLSGDYENRVIVPSFADNGMLNYFIGRSYSGSYPKYRNPSKPRTNFVFNELFLDFDSDLVIVEGVFDAFVAGRNTVPLLGSSWDDNARLLGKIIEHDTEVFIALDKDAKDKEYQIVTGLLEYDIKVHKVDLAGFKDPGSMTKQQFATQKQKAVSLTRDNILLYALNEA